VSSCEHSNELPDSIKAGTVGISEMPLLLEGDNSIYGIKITCYVPTLGKRCSMKFFSSSCSTLEHRADFSVS
jgi:hypothetical protein